MAKRYVVTLQLYIYTDKDSDAVFMANNLAKLIDKMGDNRCSVVGLAEQPFGELGNRKVEVKSQ